MTDGRDLPWLQDVDINGDGDSDVWDTGWQVEWRDVVIVDSTNTRLGTFNLTSNNLADSINYSLLKDTITMVAEDNPIWQNDSNPMDVNNDSVISPVGDVLTCINELNNRSFSNDVGRLPIPATPTPYPYLDVNGDYLISPVGDVLALINHLNNTPSGEGGAEGESYVAGELALTTNLVHSGDAAEVESPATRQVALIQWLSESPRGDTAAPLSHPDDSAAPEPAGEGVELGSELIAELASLWSE